jgi:hypothetical protein
MKQGQATYKQKATDWQKIESIHQYIHYSIVENNLHVKLSQLLYFLKKNFVLLTISVLGNKKLKRAEHFLMTEMLPVSKNFIRKRFTVKSKDFFNPQASVPYIRIDKHLPGTSCNTTSSEAILPTLPSIVFNER